MISTILTASLIGLDSELIRVETDISQGLPQLSIVGLPDMTVRESKERVRSALSSSGCDFPLRRITVNLSPADTRKEGSHFDLPIAVGILIASGNIDSVQTAGSGFFGELSLDGTLNRAEYGVALALGMKEKGVLSMFVPESNMGEFTHIDGVSFYPAESVSQVIGHLKGERPIVPVVFHDESGGWDDERGYCGADGAGADCGGVPGGGADCGGDVRDGAGRRDSGARGARSAFADFADVKGQERAKRAFQICAAGRHDIALYGPPGSGKSMLASRMPSILPPLTRREVLEVTKIYNIAGRDPYEGRAVCGRPYRAPHHSITPTALVGGGPRPRPGELSLAHKGVLFLDELPEFNKHALEMLRQPLEDRYIDLSRIGRRSRYPCEFILIAAMNPCPCGYYGDSIEPCRCTEHQRRRYASRVSGPLLDRIDLHVHVGRIEYGELEGQGGGGSGGVDVRDSGGSDAADVQGGGGSGSADGHGGGSCSADLYTGVRRAVEAQARRNPGSECDPGAAVSGAVTGAGGVRVSGGAGGLRVPEGAGSGAAGAGDGGFVFNGDLAPEDTERLCAMSEGAAYILKAAYSAYGFSARQGRKMQRIARTIADLDGSDEILPEHITEAVSYRRPSDILGAGA